MIKHRTRHFKKWRSKPQEQESVPLSVTYQNFHHIIHYRVSFSSQRCKIKMAGLCVNTCDLALMLAPFSTSIRTTGTWPPKAPTCNGVFPFCTKSEATISFLLDTVVKTAELWPDDCKFESDQPLTTSIAPSWPAVACNNSELDPQNCQMITNQYAHTVTTNKAPLIWIGSYDNKTKNSEQYQ